MCSTNTGVLLSLHDASAAAAFHRCWSAGFAGAAELGRFGMAELVVLAVDPADPDPAHRRRLIDKARRGRVVRLIAGRYVLASAFEAASAHERHRVRIRAVLPRASERLVVSHESAVALHGLPWLGDFPVAVTVTDPLRTDGQRRAHLQKAGGAGRDLQETRVQGLPVTSLVVTGVDVALRSPFAAAVVVLDALLAQGIQRRALLDELRSRTPRPRARTRARRAIEFADGAAGSPGESLCRLRMAELGFPVPVLQQEFTDERGRIGFVDFWFAEQGVIVEFDGFVKYRDPGLRNGRSPEEAVIAEKLREDRLRARPRVRTLVRVVWADVQDDDRLSRALTAAGLPRGS
jgi:hypothetical protein